jgi:23S rRNA-/tRNA-specific pseudouridylate synthase
MKINQKEDGSGEIVFTDQEIEIINKNKKLVMSPKFLKHFINLFMSVFFEYQKKFDTKTRNISTTLDQEIQVKKPEDDV